MKTLLDQIHALGQQVWLDNLSRDILASGELKRLIAQGVRGITTNPAIFHAALRDGQHYAADLARLKATEPNPEARYEALVIADVRAACDLLAPFHRHSDGREGYVSLEVSPALADDAAGTVAAARRLAAAVARPNLLIKIPATPAGLQAMETLTVDGIHTNITLIFSLAHARASAEAWVRALERRRAEGKDLNSVHSVASLFLSRTDTALDPQLPPQQRGESAIAIARIAFAEAKKLFAEHDLPPQPLLWASTGTKNPAYSALHYVEPLIGGPTVTTLPPATLAALLAHDQVQATLEAENDLAHARSHLNVLAQQGIRLDALGERLQKEGLKQFRTAYAALLALVA